MSKKKRKMHKVTENKKGTKLVIKPSLKYKEDDIHGLNNNINRGVGFNKSKKRILDRKKKHKNGRIINDDF